MSNSLLDFIEKHAVADEFLPLIEPDLFTYHEIIKNPYVAVELWLTDGSQLHVKGVGFAKCHPVYDKFDFLRGRSIAIRRAGRDLMDMMGTAFVKELKAKHDAIEAALKERDRLVDESDDDYVQYLGGDFGSQGRDPETVLFDDDGVPANWDEEINGPFRDYVPAMAEPREIAEESKSKRSKLNVGTNFVIK